MPDTIREQVVAAFAAKVGASRTEHLDDGAGSLPARVIWDNTETAERTQYGAMQCTIELNVEYIAAVDSATYPTLSQQANAMLGELIQDATNGDNTLGGLCRWITYTQNEFIYPDGGTDEVQVLASFSVVYQFAAGDPFTAA